MNKTPRSREHIHSVFLNASHYISISKLSGNLEIGKSAAILLALNRGLYELEVLPEEEFSLLDKRYKRPLKEIIEANKRKRESTHTPVIEIEKEKLKIDLEKMDKIFKGRLEQWNFNHPDPDWKNKSFELAEEWKSRLQSARDILVLRDMESAR